MEEQHMGIVRKVVIGAIAVGAAKMAMKSKKVNSATQRIAKNVRRAVGLKAMKTILDDAAKEAKPAVRRVARKVRARARKAA